MSNALLLIFFLSLLACRITPDTLPQTMGRTEVENDPCKRAVVRAISERMTEIEMCSLATYTFVRLQRNNPGQGWQYEILTAGDGDACPIEYINRLMVALTASSFPTGPCETISKSIILPLAISGEEGALSWTKQATRKYMRWKQEEKVTVWPVLKLYYSRTVF